MSFEDRQDLLGHRSGRITTHYSAAELRNLIAAADMACEEKNIPSLVVLRGAVYNATPEENLRQLHGSRAGLTATSFFFHTTPISIKIAHHL